MLSHSQRDFAASAFIRLLLPSLRLVRADSRAEVRFRPVPLKGHRLATVHISVTGNASFKFPSGCVAGEVAQTVKFAEAMVW